MTPATWMALIVVGGAWAALVIYHVLRLERMTLDQRHWRERAKTEEAAGARARRETEALNLRIIAARRDALLQEIRAQADSATKVVKAMQDDGEEPWKR